MLLPTELLEHFAVWNFRWSHSNPPSADCWSILAFGFAYVNHRHRLQVGECVVCICFLTGHPSRFCVRTFTTSITGLQMLGAQSQQTYTIRFGRSQEERFAHCAMVERPGLGPESCDYQSHVLTSYTTSPYNGAF